MLQIGSYNVLERQHEKQRSRDQDDRDPRSVDGAACASKRLFRRPVDPPRSHRPAWLRRYLTDSHLPPRAVIDVATILSDDERAFVVGGQSLNLWAEYYSESAAELLEFRPYTSKDIEYFGNVPLQRSSLQAYLEARMRRTIHSGRPEPLPYE